MGKFDLLVMNDYYNWFIASKQKLKFIFWYRNFYTPLKPKCQLSFIYGDLQVHTNEKYNHWLFKNLLLDVFLIDNHLLFLIPNKITYQFFLKFIVTNIFNFMNQNRILLEIGP